MYWCIARWAVEPVLGTSELYFVFFIDLGQFKDFLCIGEPQFTLVYDQSRRTKTWDVIYLPTFTKILVYVHIFFLFALWHSFDIFFIKSSFLYFYSNAMWNFILLIVVTSMVRILRFCTVHFLLETNCNT